MFKKRPPANTANRSAKRSKFMGASTAPASKTTKVKKPLTGTAKKIDVTWEDPDVHSRRAFQALLPDEINARKARLRRLKEAIREDVSLPLREYLGEACDWAICRGPVNANLMIIGEGPGAEEAKAGAPFVGPSGKLLQKKLTEHQINLENDVFITNTVFIRPPSNRDPYWEEVEAYLPYLQELIAIIRPKQILCLGSISSSIFQKGLGAFASIRGEPLANGNHKIKEFNADKMYRGKSNATSVILHKERLVSRVYCAYHPAYILRILENPTKQYHLDRWNDSLAEVRRLLDEARFQYIDAAEIIKETQPPDFEYTEVENCIYPRKKKYSEIDKGLYARNGLEFEMRKVDYDEVTNEFLMFGKTIEGMSVSLQVQDPTFCFYVTHPYIKYRRLQGIETLQSALHAKVVESGRFSKFAEFDPSTVRNTVSLSIESRLKYMDIGKMKDYLKVEYYNYKHKDILCRALDAYFAECCPDWRPPKDHISIKTHDYKAIKTLEADRTPLQQLLNDRNIYVRGWVTVPAASSLTLKTWKRITSCDLEYRVRTADLVGYSPNPGEAGENGKWERQAPTSTLALDAEMLSLTGVFPRSEQDPIISICAYAATSDRPDGKNYTEKIRTSAAGKSSEIRSTGRSYYDDAVVFAVGSLEEIAPSEYKNTCLPNIPTAPTKFTQGWESGGIDKSGKSFTEVYGAEIRQWNGFIESCKNWLALVGTHRTERIVSNKTLLGKLRKLEVRPGGSGFTKEWKDEKKILEWEDNVRYVVEHFKAGVKKKDVANLKLSKDWLDRIKTLPQEEAEAEFGTIQARWRMFRPPLRVHSFKTEAEMIRGFYHYVVDYDPDIITGYNSNNFDLAYFINRVRALDLKTSFDEYISMGKVLQKPDEDITKTSYSVATGERTYHMPKIPGVDAYDLMNYTMRDCKLSSYTLASVAQYYLKDTKNDVPYSAIPSLFKNNRERLNAYCAKDAELVLMLINDMNNMNYLISLARLIGLMHVDRLYVDGKQEQVFSVLLKFLRNEGRGKLMADRNKYSKEKGSVTEAFEGAHVFDPKTKGLYEKLLLCLDYNSLYPTIMLAHNLGHDKAGTAARMLKMGISLDNCFKSLRTFIEPKTGQAVYWYFVKPRTFTPEQAKAAGFEEKDCNVTPEVKGAYIFEFPNGERYRSYNLEEDGLKAEDAVMYLLPKKAVWSPKDDDATICGAIKKMLAARRRVNQEKDKYHPSSDEYRRLNMIQMALKIVCNSAYGATGVKSGKLAGIFISATVTGVGKMTILNLANQMQIRYNSDTQGGDTDSIFVHFPHIDTLAKIYEIIDVRDEVTGEITKMTRIQEVLNFANSLVPKPMKIDFEKAFEKMFAMAKKRATTLTQMPFLDPLTLKFVFKEAKLEYKGLDNKRRDSCKIAQKIITGFIERIMSYQGTKEDREMNAVNYVLEEVTKIMKGDVPFHEMIQSRQLSKKEYAVPVPHYVLAEKMRKRGERPRELGERVSFVVVTGRKTRSFAESVEDPNYALEHDMQVDLSYLVEKKIESPIMKFTNCMENGKAYNGLMFGSNKIVHDSNLLENDLMFKFLDKLTPCLICKTPSRELVCPKCKPDTDWNALIQKETTILNKETESYNKAMGTCRRCTGVGPNDGIDCGNDACTEYFPRIRGELNLKKRHAKIQKLKDMEDLF